jgi:hypothetical protein
MVYTMIIRTHTISAPTERHARQYVQHPRHKGTPQSKRGLSSHNASTLAVRTLIAAWANECISILGPKGVDVTDAVVDADGGQHISKLLSANVRHFDICAYTALRLDAGNGNPIPLMLTTTDP